jgi:transcription-repair coupling factor (superfamily II helicase)
MPFSELTDTLRSQMALKDLSKKLTRLQRRGAALRVAPVLSTARTPVVAALAEAGRTILYIVSNADAALRTADDLAQWLGEGSVMRYPASDAMPYEHMSPGHEVLSQRLRVLRQLSRLRRQANRDDLDPAPPCVIVAPVKALLQPTLTTRELTAASVTLKRGDEVVQDELIRQWLEQGYRMAPSVEEPGELNRRGGIVDIWPMGEEQPLRIEWFGDEIDSLRSFDAETQRSDQRLDSAEIGPPHEVPFWKRASAMSDLESLDVSNLRSEAQEGWQHNLEQLSQGERFEGRPFYAPFFRGQSHDPNAPLDSNMSLLAHLPNEAVVICNEQVLLEQTAHDLIHQAEEQRASLLLSQELPRDFPRPYFYWREAMSGSRAPLLDLSNNELESGAEEQLTYAGQQLHPDLIVWPQSFFINTELFGGQLRRFVGDLIQRIRNGEQVVAVTPQAARIDEMVRETLAGKDPAQANSERRAKQKKKQKQKQQQQQVQSEEPNEEAVAEPAITVEDYPELANFKAIHGIIDGGWRSLELNLTLYTDLEIFGLRQRRSLTERRKQKERSTTERAAFLRGLKIGDYVVHIEHGIALYEGLLRRTLDKVEREYLVLRYAAGDKLYVPVDQVDRITRYIGAGDIEPQLTRLGTQEWERAKRKVRQAVRDLANELLALYAARQLTEGHAFSPDNEWQREIESAFPYVETDDQLRAINDIKADMERVQPMDRLLCGDVGFGKTEVALRAAFKAVQDGKQVAILVPTTVLAQQHYDTFRQRMEAFPVNIEMLSRFRSAKEQEAITLELSKGTVDIIIGTHRLLSKDVLFKDLGLVIVDEEQRFGVRHKERLKQLRSQVDVLTLTATPIPRTLHMSLAGIRDLSVIDTPPEDRMPIKTYVLPSEDTLIREALLREIERGGQVYFVHNRVHSIYHVASHIQALVPEARIGVGHGQLDERQLEKVMLAFFKGEYDVLVCTTIIESGIDVPNANTIIIDDATNYGLAQLYQLRGRVGRSANRAYAYLLYKGDRRMTEEAQQRLQAIQEATELGAGFRIAMRDLEIRGAGNLLGAEQSGHISSVGFDLYSRLLEQAVKDMKNRFERQQEVQRALSSAKPKAPKPSDPDKPKTRSRPEPVKIDEKVLVTPLVTLDLPLTAFLPPEYIANDAIRLGVYQRMGEAQTPSEVRGLRQELRDRFGELPEPAEHLLTWLLIKSLALLANVSSVLTTSEEFIVRLPEAKLLDRDRLRRHFVRDKTIKVGPQFVRLDRRMLGEEWIPKLEELLEVLSKIDELPPPPIVAPNANLPRRH